MFHYKSVQYKSNYLRVKIKAGADYENTEENIYMKQGECELIFSLFGGERMVSARYVAGRIGNDVLIGETVVNYAYENGAIKVCAYDFEHKGHYDEPQHYIRPFFRLMKGSLNNDIVCSEEPLLTVSGNSNVKHACNVNNLLLLNTAPNIKDNLRMIYSNIIKELTGTGICLSIHVDDIVEVDENGNIVNGSYFNVETPFNDYFYNIDRSAAVTGTAEPADLPPTGSWLKYYHDKILANTTVPVHNVAGHKYCASQGYSSLGCTSTSLSKQFLGGHILKNVNGGKPISMTRFNHSSPGWESSGLADTYHRMPLNTSTNTGDPVYKQTEDYYMLPICYKHNNTNNYDVVMKAVVPEDLMVLRGFKSNYKY